MISKIKSNILWILGGLVGILALLARHFYAQSVAAKVRVKQGEDKVMAAKEKAKVDRLLREVKSAEKHRKALLKQYRDSKLP